MNIIFRVDASDSIGSGHVMRCLTLAEMLHSLGNTIAFLMRALPGNMIDLVTKKGFGVLALPNHNRIPDDESMVDIAQCAARFPWFAGAPDWIIVDHYQLDHRWHAAIRPFTYKLMVIDDLANRPLDCDLLLNQNLISNLEAVYRPLIPKICHCLLGPKYTLLRPEFKLTRLKSHVRTGSIQHIFIFMGATDPYNLTLEAINCLAEFKLVSLRVDVVVGKMVSNKQEIETRCNQLGFNYLTNVKNMATLMSESDLSIGSGGITTWERFCLGLPSIVSIIADNQREVVSHLTDMNLIFYCDVQTYKYSLSSTLENLMRSPGLLIENSHRISQIIDGDGTHRVIAAMEALSIQGEKNEF